MHEKDILKLYGISKYRQIVFSLAHEETEQPGSCVPGPEVVET